MTDCGCNTEHQVIETRGDSESEHFGFYVSIREDRARSPRYGLLLGPFDTHDEALAKVSLGRRLAHEANPSDAAFASFGTCKVTGEDLKPGLLNSLADSVAGVTI